MTGVANGVSCVALEDSANTDLWFADDLALSDHSSSEDEISNGSEMQTACPSLCGGCLTTHRPQDITVNDLVRNILDAASEAHEEKITISQVIEVWKMRRKGTHREREHDALVRLMTGYDDCTLGRVVSDLTSRQDCR